MGGAPHFCIAQDPPMVVLVNIFNFRIEIVDPFRLLISDTRKLAGLLKTNSNRLILVKRLSSTALCPNSLELVKNNNFLSGGLYNSEEMDRSARRLLENSISIKRIDRRKKLGVNLNIRCLVFRCKFERCSLL